MTTNTRNFAGKVNMDQFYVWMNAPDLPHADKYSPTRLLADFVEVDEEIYDYFLGMMPPKHFTASGFAICEEVTCNIRLAFFRIEGRYFAAHIVDVAPGAAMMAATRDLIARQMPEVAHV